MYLNQAFKRVDDCEAAFPTAQWVAAMRAADAENDTPVIGSNIDAGPDTLAAALAGDQGRRILEIYTRGGDVSASIGGLVARTLAFDASWVKALESGCEQFVILAAGLDGRAWRMPRMSKDVTVFEVDVPRAHNYKTKKLAELETPPQLSCRRVTVNADLSQPTWKDKLIAAGFDPSKRSFFLIEGLLMYLPPGAPQALFKDIGAIAAKGSVVTGDTFVNLLSAIDQTFVKSLGTKWTFEFPSDDAITTALAAAGLTDAVVKAVSFQPQSPGEPEADFETSSARKMQGVFLSVSSWPSAILSTVIHNISTGGAAALQELCKQGVDDEMNFHNLRDVEPDVKKRIVALIMDLPLRQQMHGTTDFSTAMQAEVAKLSDSTPTKGFLRRWSESISFIFMMLRFKLTGRAMGNYMIFTAQA